MKKLKIEFNANKIEDKKNIPGFLITPSIDENYWIARVHLYEDQYIVAFPKFMTIGCGFAKEEDWNTNLPIITCSAEQICNHIWHNRRYVAIKKKRTIKAIQMLKDYFNQI